MANHFTPEELAKEMGMEAQGIIQILVFLAVLTALTPLIGGYMAKVFTGRRVWLTPVLGPVERGLTRVFGSEASREQDWKQYAKSAIVFSAVSWLLLYLIIRTQSIMPFNPQGLTAPPWDLTFNTTSSFLTNTNWQFYGGETTMSYFTQMAGLAVQNFLSAAIGIAVLIAFIRGLTGRSGTSLGNFWQDLLRSLIYVLVPISVLAALFFVSQGVIQNLDAYSTFDTLTGGSQTLGMGPVASQEAIKLLGTNGGGFFNVNSSMPFENPTGLANFVQILLILIIPAGLTATFGRMAGSRRQGWVIYAAMMILFIVAVGVVYSAESHGSVAQHLAGVSGGNMEGKETRFGIADSSLFAAVTTVASCGAVNAILTSIAGRPDVRECRISQPGGEALDLLVRTTPLELPGGSFVIAAVMASLGGALFAPLAGIISPSNVDATASIMLLAGVALGGRASLFGAALGAIAVGYGQSTLSEQFPTQWTYFQGALFIVVMLFLPGGIASLWKKASSLLPTRSPKEATADVTVPSPTEAVA